MNLRIRRDALAAKCPVTLIKSVTNPAQRRRAKGGLVTRSISLAQELRRDLLQNRIPNQGSFTLQFSFS